MRLSAVVLDQSSTLNNLKYINQAQFYPGETGEIWIQLVDLDASLAPNVYARYMPASGATLTANFFSNNDANNLQKPASQPFASDPSIWKVTLASSETSLLAGVNMGLKLIEGPSVKQAMVNSVVFVAPRSPFQC